LKIGIPRALLYFWYGRMWEEFWLHSGCEVKISPPTTHQIMNAGIELAVDELCLPIKIFLGHVIALATQVDWIMIPHLIQVQKNAFICPKFMGLPDIVSHAIPSIRQKLLIVRVGSHHLDMVDCLCESSQDLGLIPGNLRNLKDDFLKMMYQPALAMIKKYQPQEFPQNFSKLRIGLLGHPYCLYDACLNLDLLHVLAHEGVYFYTPEMIPKNYQGIGSGKLPKELFWTTGKMQFDALEWLVTQSESPIDGFIHIAPFACGPEAIVGDMIGRRIQKSNKPFLMLNYEEQSGEAGVITRLEAFTDLIKYQHIAC
jgi:predicted nucleotide-binding protein (sugar kinase/HSP70/actin superfamily)